MCDYKEIMRVIRPVNFILVCGKKTANSSTLANLQQRIGKAICQGEEEEINQDPQAPHQITEEREFETK
jgi:hypothetical protein